VRTRGRGDRNPLERSVIETQCTLKWLGGTEMVRFQNKFSGAKHRLDPHKIIELNDWTSRS